MMKKYILYFVALVALPCITLTACKKGDNEKLDGDNDPISDFMSTKEGSWWMYGSNEGTVTIRRATGKDSTMLERVYNYYETTDTASQYVNPEYFGKNQDKFLMLVDMDLNGNKQNYINVVVQKDNPTVGDSWSNTGSLTYAGMPFDLLTEGEIKSIGGTMVLNGATYTEVTEIENQLKFKPKLHPVYAKCGTARMWFAKGIGIIKSDFDISIGSLYSRQYTDSLLSYHLVP